MNSQEILMKEFEDLKQNPLSLPGYTIELFNQNNIYEWKITLLGAKDTPYADGIFFIKLSFPQDYPDRAPRINFLTPIYHPNVNPSDGYVCVNFIRNDWKKTTSVREILTKLYSIFYLVNPESPFSYEQAYEYKEHRSEYYFKVQVFTKHYANIKLFKDFKSEKWDFSIPPKQKYVEINKYLNNNEKIKLSFNINGGLKKYCIECNSDMIVYQLLGIIRDIREFYKPLLSPIFIYEGRKLYEHSTLRENGLKNDSHITIIEGVHY